MADNEMLSNILKNLSLAGSGLGTGILGTIPAATSLMATGGKKLSQFLNPEDTEVHSSLDWLKNLSEKATPEALQGYAQQATGGYLKPETAFQKGISEFSTDIGSSLWMGGTGITAATIGNTAKQGALALGESEETANKAKLFGTIASSAFKFKNIKSLYNDLYKDAEMALQKQGTKGILQSKSIRDAATDVYNKTLKGTGKSTSKIGARRIAKGALSKLKDPYTSVSEVWEINKDINHELAKMGKYTDQKAYFLKPLRGAVNSKLELYGNRNKDFGSAFKNAQTLFGIENGLPFLDKVINKAAGLKDTGLAEYFRKSMAWGAGGIKGILAKNALGSISKKLEAYHRSPAYRNASMQLAKAAAVKNAPMAANAMRKLVNIHDEYKNGFANKQGIRFKFIKDVPSQKSEQNKMNFKSITPEDLQQKIKD